jgi:hypothetical protein
MEKYNAEKKKIVLEGDFENVLEIDDHYYLISKKDRVAVIPYTIDSKGLLDKIGVTEDWNHVEEEKEYTLITDYISTDDDTDLVCANRILFEIIGTNVTDAMLWMYLGKVSATLLSDSPIKLYACDITNIPVKADEEVEEEEERKFFKLLDSSRVLQTDDMLFLSAYIRLFNYFYVNSIQEK